MDETIRSIFAEVFRLPASEVRDSLRPEDVKGWDSLGHLALVTELEASFGISLHDDDVTHMETVGRIKEILRRRGVVA